MDVRDGHGAVHQGVQLLPVAGGRDANDVRAPGLDLLHVAHQLVKQGMPAGQSHHQGAVLNEGDGPVLQLAGGVRLRVDVGDLLQLE